MRVSYLDRLVLSTCAALLGVYIQSVYPEGVVCHSLSFSQSVNSRLSVFNYDTVYEVVYVCVCMCVSMLMLLAESKISQIS